MEKHILKSVDFDIGIPLSYTFLRRYAQVITDLSDCLDGNSVSVAILWCTYQLQLQNELKVYNLK